MLTWKMDPYQKHLVRDKSRNRAINKSKKTGISTTIAGESIYKAYTNAGRQVIFVSTGQRIAEELLGKWYDMLATIPQALQPNFDKHSMQVARLPNGSRVMSLPSSDPGNIRGFGMRGPETDVYLDEYAHVVNDKELWIVVRDFQIIGGNITLNSTPKGKRGKFYEIVEPLQAVYHGLIQKTDTNWSYHEITYRDCPRLNAQEEFLRAGMTDIDFQQEYEAVFCDESLAFFTYDLLEPNQNVKEFVATGYKTNNPIYFGIDFGKTTSETIIWIVEETAPETFKTLYIEEMAGVNYDEQADVIKMLKLEYDPISINIDASGPGGITMEDILSTEKYCGPIIHGYDLTSLFKENIIIRARMLMQRKKFGIPHKDMGKMAEKIERQFHGIQRTSTKMGLHTRYSGKESVGMDDFVWAACYDKDTEVLTEDGWKLFKDILLLDKIATLNPETNQIEYFNPMKIIQYYYNEKMLHFKGKGIDLMVTPNHRIYASKHYSGNTFRTFDFYNAEDLIGKQFKLKKDAKWIGKRQEFFTIPKLELYRKHPSNNYIREEKKIPMDLWLEFFGYFISEGNSRENSIGIYQSLYYNPKKCEKIKKCLKEMEKYDFSLKEHIGKGRHGKPMMRWHFYDKQLSNYLLIFGKSHDKFIPKELKALPKEQLKILFDALYLGDGVTDGHTYYTSSPKLRDDVMEIVLKMGLTCNYSVDNGSKGITYNIMIANRTKCPRINHHNHYGSTIEEINYNDYVYCLEVPNHIIYVRRNGKPIWCGNCLAVYKEFEFNFEPLIVQIKDETLERLQKQSQRPESDVALAW